ncbi:MAG: hypothetical protein ABI969_11735 [bacterium]
MESDIGDSVHRRDATIVDSPRVGDTVHVNGGWADASNYLQYATTSENATDVMLMSYRDYPNEPIMDGTANRRSYYRRLRRAISGLPA